MHVKCYWFSISVVLCYNVSERIYRKGEQSGVKQKLLLIILIREMKHISQIYILEGNHLKNGLMQRKPWMMQRKKWRENTARTCKGKVLEEKD